MNELPKNVLPEPVLGAIWKFRRGLNCLEWGASVNSGWMIKVNPLVF